MKRLLLICCVFQMVTSVPSNSLSFLRLFEGRGNFQIQRNSTRLGAQLNIKNKFEEEKRKDQIKRQICKLINIGCSQNEEPSRKLNPVVKPLTIKSEPADIINDTNCMMFRIPQEYFNERVEFNRGELKVHIQLRKPKSAKKVNKKYRRTIFLNITSVDSQHRQQNLMRYRIRIRKTKWHKMNLLKPILRDIQENKLSIFRICIHCSKCNKRLQCSKCNKRVRITYPLSTKRKRKNKKKGKKGVKKGKKNRRRKAKNRPKLILFSKNKITFHRKRRSSTQCETGCCRSARFISYKELNITDEIISPQSGFFVEKCIGYCSLGSNIDKLNPLYRRSDSVCRATSSEPLNMTIRYIDGISFPLSLPEARVTSCKCFNHIR